MFVVTELMSELMANYYINVLVYEQISWNSLLK